MEPRLGLVILAVTDLPAMAAFYDRAFGWPRMVDLPVFVQYRLPAEQSVGLYARAGFGANIGELPAMIPAGQVGSTELYLLVDVLEAACARLEAAGARLLSPASERPWGDRAAYYADPEGNVLAVAIASDEGD